MKNEYRIYSDGSTGIFIDSPKYGMIETLIDTEDLEKVKKIAGWRVNWRKNSKCLVVVGRYKNEQGKWIDVQLHRYVLGITNPKLQVDHINHNTLDNRKSQLRVVTAAQNSQNRRLRKDNKSGHTGVTWCNSMNKWHAQIGINYDVKSLGYYTDLDSAVEARKKAEEKYFQYKTSITQFTN